MVLLLGRMGPGDTKSVTFGRPLSIKPKLSLWSLFWGGDRRRRRMRSFIDVLGGYDQVRCNRISQKCNNVLYQTDRFSGRLGKGWNILLVEIDH